MGMVWTHGRLATLLNAKKEESRFIPKNSQQLNRNRTCAENRNNWPTIEQQPTNKRTNIPTDPMKKKKQTTSRAEERHRFYPSPPQHGAVMKEKKASKRLGWSRHLSLSFFCVPTLSLFTFPRTTTKNIENSVDPR